MIGQAKEGRLSAVSSRGFFSDYFSLEEAINKHPDVEESLVIGAPDDLKGQIPLALFVPKSGNAKRHF